MPAKPTKYGIKVWMCADLSNGYVLNFQVYLGKNDDYADAGLVQAHGLGYYVVTTMLRPFYNQFHHVYFDNFFTSPQLLEDLL